MILSPAGVIVETITTRVTGKVKKGGRSIVKSRLRYRTITYDRERPANMTYDPFESDETSIVIEVVDAAIGYWITAEPARS